MGSHDNLIRRWMFYNCPKAHAWIVYQNIRSILEGTDYKVAPGHHQSVSIPVPKIVHLTIPKRGAQPKTVTDPQTDEQVEFLSHIEPEDIKYVHSAIITTTNLYALVETDDGLFTIENHRILPKDEEKNKKINKDEEQNKETTEKIKTVDMLKVEVEPSKKEDEKEEEETIKSILTFYDSFNHLMQKCPKQLLRKLEIKKESTMKLTQNQQNRLSIPPEWTTSSSAHSYLDRDLISTPQEDGPDLVSLDLSNNFVVTSNDLSTWTPTGQQPTKLILNTCWQLRDSSWSNASGWAKSILQLELINLPQLTNEMAGEIVRNLSNLRELSIHLCPQINIRVLLEVCKTDYFNLEVLNLNNPTLVCQPNDYAGLITDDEWKLFRNYSVTQLFINSTNTSLDVIDYIKTSFLRLQTLILDDGIYTNLKKNLVPGTPGAKKILICSTGNKKIELPRDFMIRNLLRSQFQQPFSDSMMKIMQTKWDEQKDNKSDTICNKSDMICNKSDM